MGVLDVTAEELQGVLNNTVLSAEAAGLVLDQIGPSIHFVTKCNEFTLQNSRRKHRARKKDRDE